MRHAALRLHALVETLYATGLRVSELVSLPVTVALRDERFFVVRGKGAKDRMVPLSGKARDAMRLWLAERSSRPALAESPWLFSAASDTGYLPRQVFARDLKGLAARTGISSAKISPHVLRHAFASHLLRTAPICALYSNCSVMLTFRPRKDIRMCLRKGWCAWCRTTTRLPIPRPDAM